jgi:hypothetical protein
MKRYAPKVDSDSETDAPADSSEMAKACSLVLGAAAMVCVESGYSDEEAVHGFRAALGGVRVRSIAGGAH